MNYVYDILLNFLDGPRIYEFFEWQKQDKIKNINRIPVFVVNEKSFSDLINNEVIIDKDFLDIIKNKTTVFSSKNDNIIKYAFLITNKERCYGIKLNEEGMIIGKSSLLLDEEDEILELSNSIIETQIIYKVTKYIKKNKIHTRTEENKIKFITKELEKAYKEKNEEKLNYIYNEVLNDRKKEGNYEKLINALNKNNKEVIKRLYFILKLSSNIYTKREI